MLLAIFLLCCLGLGWFGLKNLIKARIIEDTATSKVRSASQGYVELEGFAKPLEGKQLLAPLTGKPCLWFSFKVERHDSSGKSNHWRTVESAVSDNLFILEDNTGQCYINPAKAEVIAMSKQSWRGHGRRPAVSTPDLLSGLVQKKTNIWGGNLNISFGGGKYRYTEQRLHKDQFIYAIGQFQTLHAPSNDQQTKAQMNVILNQWKQNQQQLLDRFDSDDNGEIDSNEWQQARAEAAKQAFDYVRDNYDDKAVNTLSYSTEKRQPFILSTVDPRSLTSRYRWTAFICLAAALGCGVYSATIILRI